MGLFGKIVLGLLTLGALGSVWAATAGYGAKDIGGKSAVGKSARHGSAGRGGRYHSWK